MTASSLLFSACSTDAASPPLPGPMGVDAGGGRGDASGSLADAAVGADAGLPAPDGSISAPPGVRIASLPAELVAVTGGGAEVLFLQAGELVRVDPDGTGAVHLGYRPVLGYGPTPHLWLWSEVDAEGAVGTLGVYVPLATTPTVSVLAERVATDTFTVDESGDAALVVTDVTTIGDAASSTRTGALSRFDVTGARTEILRGLTLGAWDPRTRQHGCAPQVEWMGPTRALAVVCGTPGSSERTLLALDLAARTSSVVARDVLPFLQASDDESFALFADRTLAFHGVDARGERVVPLPEARRIYSLAFLGGTRLAYTTADGGLHVTAWPSLVPTTVLASGAEAVEAVSKDGAWLMFRQVRASSGLRDLFVVRTAAPGPTTPLMLAAGDAYPGDDAFSDDGAWAQWFARADANFIGDVMVVPTAGGTPRVLAQGGWIVRNLPDPDRVALLANARFSSNGARRLLADLTLAWRDGRGPNAVLVEGLDAAAFEIFPDGERAVFRISDGAYPGLWVRGL